MKVPHPLRHPFAKHPILKKILAITAVSVTGLIAVLIAWLMWWDGGISTAKDRELVPGVRLNLQTINTKQGPVEYDMYGTEGPVIMSIHGGFGGADQGRLFASWLQDDRYRILSPSRPGYLGTPLASGKTFDEQADLLVALLDELKIDKVGLLSSSAGGPVAYSLAARYPDRIWGLVSIAGVTRQEPKSTSGSAMRSAFMSSIGSKLVRLTAVISPETLVKGTLDETSYFSADQKTQRTAHIMETPEKKAFFEAMLGTTFPYDQRIEGNDNDTEQNQHAASLHLSGIQAPTLVVHGTQDADVPLYNGVYAYEHIPGAQRYWMEQEDHLGFWLSPDAQSAQSVARAFLRQHVPF